MHDETRERKIMLFTARGPVYIYTVTVETENGDTRKYLTRNPDRAQAIFTRNVGSDEVKHVEILTEWVVLDAGFKVVG